MLRKTFPLELLQLKFNDIYTIYEKICLIITAF